MQMIYRRERCIDVAPVRIIFAGGGTGGHLYPAIAIADEIKNNDPGAQILFIGTKQKIEARVVPQRGYQFRTIWISGFRRKIHFETLVFPCKVLVSMIQARSIIKDFAPDVVVGTGGYVSGPVLRVASMLGVPTLIQEQNSYPGATTRLLAKKVNEVHLTFESSKQYVARAKNIFISGNPTRSDLNRYSHDDACKYFGFDPDGRQTTVLIFGGSLGAHTINNAVEKHLSKLMQHNLRVIWQTGIEDYAHLKEIVKPYSHSRLWINAYIDHMEYAYAASDLVVCRAGATTIAELTVLGKPALLIPYPLAAANHQVENAHTMVESGAAEILYDNEAIEKLLEKISTMLDGTRLKKISNECKKLGKPDAARDIARHVLHLARKNQ
jgi:UDP-N-acetylglucosamine--N-acetylmuramyl-(pentapeptide) pyrophosphoryl-undecaprenol N-acetylglucosamine transferase